MIVLIQFSNHEWIDESYVLILFDLSFDVFVSDQIVVPEDLF